MIYLFLGLLWAIIVGGGLYFALPRNVTPVFPAVSGTIAFVLGSILAYLSTPVIGVFYAGFWVFLALPVIITLVISIVFKMDNYRGDEGSPRFPMTTCYAALLSFTLVFAFITTSPMINSIDYHELLTVQQDKEFDPESIMFDQSQSRFVDQDLAVRAANEILGKERGMASRYSVDTMRIQSIDGELRWLAPFKHASITRWIDDSTAPGYVSVSVNEYSDVAMNVDDSDINFGDSNFYFSSYIYRHVYQNGYATTIIDDFKIEIDREGKPFWVGSILEPQVGFSGKIVTGVVVVDAKTGGIEKYGIEDTPKWIDRIQPESIVEDLVSDWGQYTTGWWDGFVGNGVIVPTRGSSIVFTKDHNSSWYTGMRSSSSSNKESSMGFMMIDSRTGVASFYQRAGITEIVAKETIEGRVQEAGYTASNPIPYSINGQVTFLSILKDKRGNVQGVGLIAYDDRSLVAVGDNFEIALRRYLSVLTSNGSVDLDETLEVTVIESTVDRSYVQPVDNRLILNFTLDDEEYAGKFFTTSADSNKGAMLTREGDQVTIKVYSLESDEIQVGEFINTTLNP